MAGLVENLALQHAEQVEERHVLHIGPLDGHDVVGGDLRRGEHPVERPVVVHHGEGLDVAVILAQDGPGTVDGDGGVEGRGRIIVQVEDLGAHGVEQHRRLEAEAVEHELCLVAEVAETGGDKFPVAQGVAQRGVGHGGNDGVGVRVAVSGDINGFQIPSPLNVPSIAQLFSNANPEIRWIPVAF